MAVSVSPKPRRRRAPSRPAVAKKFSWAEGSRKPRKYATLLGRALDEIKNGTGKYRAEDVVNYARPKTSPIHGMFEWRESVAAERYRCIQARNHLRNLVVEIVSHGKPISMPVAVSFGPGAGYQDSQKVLETPELRRRLVAQALKEANSWRDRWKHLNELSNVFSALDEIEV